MQTQANETPHLFISSVLFILMFFSPLRARKVKEANPLKWNFTFSSRAICSPGILRLVPIKTTAKRGSRRRGWGELGFGGRRWWMSFQRHVCTVHSWSCWWEGKQPTATDENKYRGAVIRKVRPLIATTLAQIWMCGGKKKKKKKTADVSSHQTWDVVPPDTGCHAAGGCSLVQGRLWAACVPCLTRVRLRAIHLQASAVWRVSGGLMSQPDVSSAPPFVFVFRLFRLVHRRPSSVSDSHLEVPVTKEKHR